MNAEVAISITSLVVIAASMIAASYKSGYIMYSIWSQTKSKSEFEVNKDRILP